MGVLIAEKIREVRVCWGLHVALACTSRASLSIAPGRTTVTTVWGPLPGRACLAADSEHPRNSADVISTGMQKPNVGSRNATDVKAWASEFVAASQLPALLFGLCPQSFVRCIQCQCLIGILAHGESVSSGGCVAAHCVLAAPAHDLDVTSAFPIHG